MGAKDILAPLAAAGDRLKEYSTGWIEVPVVAGEQTKKAVEVFTAGAKGATHTLAGGFGKAIESSFADAGERYDVLVTNIENRPIRLTFDMDDLERKLRDHGLSPDTSGTLPGA